jgi:hypothetical protein
MTYGLETYKTNGQVLSSYTDAMGGGVYLGTYYLGAGSSGTLNFGYNVLGGFLIGYCVQAGSHEINYYTDGNGKAYVTYTAVTGGRDSMWIFFSRKTSEVDYGLLLQAVNGDYLISGLYKSARFVEKVTPSWNSEWTIPHQGWSYKIVQYTGNSDAGALWKRRIIFWKLNSTSSDVWHIGQSWIWEGQTWFDLQCILPVGSTAWTLDAYIFEVESLTASGDTWGMRVYDSSGNVTFDSSYPYLRNKQLNTGFSYPSVSYPNYGNVASSFGYGVSSTYPAILMNRYTVQRYAFNDPVSEHWEYIGAMRRDGGTYYSRMFNYEYNGDDGGNGVFRHGYSTNLMFAEIDAGYYDSI